MTLPRILSIKITQALIFSLWQSQSASAFLKCLFVFEKLHWTNIRNQLIPFSNVLNLTWDVHHCRKFIVVLQTVTT